MLVKKLIALTLLNYKLLAKVDRINDLELIIGRNVIDKILIPGYRRGASEQPILFRLQSISRYLQVQAGTFLVYHMISSNQCESNNANQQLILSHLRFRSC